MDLLTHFALFIYFLLLCQAVITNAIFPLVNSNKEHVFSVRTFHVVASSIFMLEKFIETECHFFIVPPFYFSSAL